ncbi:MAG: hypothetical protein QI199_03480, partial [Candidatus Korarchaeota archaeon]|nr:hypothetical protein [Candidatus Korarchaeota archaeon]
IFSYVLYEEENEGSFLVYKADETGEQYNFSNGISSAGSMAFPLVKLVKEPKWFSERFSNEQK